MKGQDRAGQGMAGQDRAGRGMAGQGTFPIQRRPIVKAPAEAVGIRLGAGAALGNASLGVRMCE